MNQPTPVQIYRRRRAAALIILLLVVGLIWWGISVMRDDGGSKASDSKSTTVAGPIVACPAGAVAVTAFIGNGSVSQTQFAKDMVPKLWFTLTNNSKRACTFEAGSVGQFYNITTGPDTVWQSKDCDRTGDVSAVVTLQPHQSMASPPSDWLKVKSSSTGCGQGQAPVIGGGASYHLSVTVNGVKSQNDVQFVLN